MSKNISKRQLKGNKLFKEVTKATIMDVVITKDISKFKSIYDMVLDKIFVLECKYSSLVNKSVLKEALVTVSKK